MFLMMLHFVIINTVVCIFLIGDILILRVKMSGCRGTRR